MVYKKRSRLNINLNDASLDHFISEEKKLFYIKQSRLNEINLNDASLDHFISEEKKRFI